MTIIARSTAGLTEELGVLRRRNNTGEGEDAAEEAFSRALLGSVAEPGDGVLGRAVAAVGPAAVAELLLSTATASRFAEIIAESGEAFDEREAETGLARWLPRIDHSAFVRSLRQAAHVGGRLLIPGDPEWPIGVDELGVHAPLVLWVRGRTAALAGMPSLALVGARAATSYGEHVAMEASSGLVDRGFTIISGGAYGIDGMAHRAALASGGSTVAFLAGGVDRFYPMGHESLLSRIAETGAVISEMPCGAAPTKWRFLQRNRLIAAASGATVVLEAGIRSGSLNTAGHASALGRPLGAVPGPVTSPASAGCHRLLREYDAVCVVDAEQMAELAGALPMRRSVRRCRRRLGRRPRRPAAGHHSGAVSRGAPSGRRPQRAHGPRTRGCRSAQRNDAERGHGGTRFTRGGGRSRAATGGLGAATRRMSGAAAREPSATRHRLAAKGRDAMTFPGLGRYPAARHVIAHVSDTHLLQGGTPLGGVADTVGSLGRTVEQLGRLGASLDAIVVTGDVADLGEVDAYRRAREALDPLAAAIGTRLVWVMGNHDERAPFRQELLGEPPSDAPVNRIVDIDGLRLIVLDSTVPGYHHGELDAASLAWLDSALAEPAPHGTVIALHHAPIATPLALMNVLELHGQAELAEIVRGRDVRLILGGHLHYATNGSFAGIPVSVAGATAYTMDLSAPPRELVGVDGGRSFTLVHLFDDGVVTSVVPIGLFPAVSSFSAEFLAEIEALTPEQRLERFSRKPPQR